MQKESFLFSWDSNWPPRDKGLLCANFAGRYIKMRTRRVYLSMRTECVKAFSKRIRRCSEDGRKRYEKDKCGRKSF